MWHRAGKDAKGMTNGWGGGGGGAVERSKGWAACEKECVEKSRMHACIVHSAALYSRTVIITYRTTHGWKAISRSVHLIGFNDVLANPSILLTVLMRVGLCGQWLFMSSQGRTAQVVRYSLAENMLIGCLAWVERSSGMFCDTDRSRDKEQKFKSERSRGCR